MAGILDVLDTFGKMSGLKINPTKSELYVSGRDAIPTTTVAQAVGIDICFLPIRYLGLSLTTRSMTATDYAPLLDRIRARFVSWSSRHISYAGRLQLIKSVISSIANFWFSVFRLPNRCLKAIERMCNNYLWSGSPNIHTKMKVCWEDICYPKSEGGLGLRSLTTTSQVFAFHLIWKIFTSSKSLWVSWIERHILRQHTYWNIPITLLGSWVWRKLLKLRDAVKGFIVGELNDGHKLSFWHDHWSYLGPLIQLTGANGPRVTGVPNNAKVAEATRGSQWCFRRRSGAYVSLITAIKNLNTPTPDKGPDRFLWRHKPGDFKGTFSSFSTWEQLRNRKLVVSWAKLVWFELSIPRCSFISWLAFKNRLSTGDRMALYGVHQRCVFCGEGNESRDHLFFACPYTFTVWVDVAKPLLGPSVNPDWNHNVRALHSRRLNRGALHLLKLAFQVSIDRLWRERNDRLHHSKPHTTTQVYNNIDRTVRNRLHSVNYMHAKNIQNLMELWLFRR